MKKIDKTTLLISFVWLTICGSIGMDININLIEKINKKNIYTYLNEFRVAISIVSIFAFLIWNSLLIVKKKFSTNIFFKFNTIFIFILYFFSQFIGLIQNNSDVLNYNNYYLLLLSFGTLNLFLFIINKKNQSHYKILLYILIVIILIYTLSVLVVKFDILIEALPRGHSIYSITNPNEIFMGQAISRVTGLSRSLAILNLFLIAWYFHINYNFGIIKKTIYILFILSIGLLIWAMNSRGTIICYFFALTIYFLFIFKKNFFTRVKLLLLITLIPIVTFNTFAQVQELNILPEKIDKEKIEKEKIEKEKYFFLFNNSRILNSGHNDYYSGRTILWKYAINNYQKNKIFGYGVQGDRYLLTEKFSHYGSNVSNGFIYALLSGGYVGLILFCFLFLKTFYNIVLIIINCKKLNIGLTIKSSILFLSFLLLRSGVENSFSLFSLDFLIFCISSIIIEKFVKEKKLTILPINKKIIN